MKTNWEILDYLEKEEKDGLVLITLHELGMIITCHIKSMFPTTSDYTRVKGYLRRNGFMANGFGTHTRPNEYEDKTELYGIGYLTSGSSFNKLKQI